MSLMSYALALKNLMDGITAINTTENVALQQAHGRILSQDLIAQADAPRFDNSAMDGYAICGLARQTWQLTDYVAAGEATQHIRLQPGQAVRILTGAAVPQGTEAVIAQEYIQLEANQICHAGPVKARQHIRFQAEEYAQGHVLYNADQAINAAVVGVAASQGMTHLSCYKKIKITVFSSGNELQPIGAVLTENQIYDSNLYMLLSCLEQKYYTVIDGGILLDQVEFITEKLKVAASESDVVIISGGASVGDKDLTKVCLAQLGEMQHWKLAIKPGKPFAWGKIQQAKIFLLPGNPVASWVTFHILVAPALNKLAGININQALPQQVQAQARFTLHAKQGRQQFLRGTISSENGQLYADIHAHQGSAMLANCALSNAFIIVPAQATVQQGQSIQAIYLPLV